MEKIVKRILYCTTPVYEFEQELDADKDINDTDIVEDWFGDLIYEALNQYEPVPQGTFCLEDLGEKLYGTAQAYIDKVAPGIDVFTKDITESGQQINIKRVDITELLREALQDRSEREQFYCDMGEYVEKSLMLFEKLATWHIGFQCEDCNAKEMIDNTDKWPAPCKKDDGIVWEKNHKRYKPILWFGIEGNDPDPIWTICDDNESFWRWHCPVGDLVDEDYSDAFTYWYMECGMAGPDGESILNNCPLGYINDEDWVHLDERINEFFLKKYENL